MSSSLSRSIGTGHCESLRKLSSFTTVRGLGRAGGGGSEGVGRILSFSWGNEGNKLSLKNIKGRLLKLTVKEGELLEYHRDLEKIR